MLPHLRRLRGGAVAFVLGATTLLPLAATPTAQAATHVANPYVGATSYLNPDYTAEVNAQATADGGTQGAAEAKMANYQTAVWMDRIAAITGDTVHHGLQFHLDNALAQQQGTTPIVFEVVIYDLPGRDCAALASNGEIPATAAGLTEYETQYIDPIAAIMSNSKYANIRIVATIEPDSLPNAVTNQSKPACATATPFYEQGVEYALNKLHAIPNVYNYVDIAHSAWLGWPSNLGPGAQEFAKVARATTAGFASIDGFISNTANYTPTTEPFLPNSTLNVGGNPLDSVTFYQYNPYFDEFSYDNAMYSQLVSNGFPSSIGILIDTSRNGWGGSNRPTALNSSPTTAAAYVAANKVDMRSFRGDWCNQAGAGIGARPQAQPYGASSPIIGFVWIKPPGESDGDYPTASHTHGDPHCDPAGTNTDGNGGTYTTGSIAGFDVPAGQWFAAEFQQEVQNAYPSLGAGSGDTTPPSAPTGVTVTGTTSTSVSLSWTASTDNVGVTGYNVYRGGTLAGTTASTSFTDTGLTASTAYSYTVKAFDAAANLSAASAAVTATTAAGSGDTTPPSAPANLAVTGTTSSTASLSWTASTDNVGVTGYHVYRGSTLAGSTTTATTFTDTGLTASTAYSYTVKAFDAAGNLSAASAAVTATTAAGSTGGGGCSASLHVDNSWGTGFTGTVTVTNTGTAATHAWTVTWTWPGNQQVTNMWNATGTQTGTSEKAVSMPYNGAIAPGGNTTFGLQASYTGTNTAPTLTCTAS